MQPGGPPRLFIEPPHPQAQQHSATSPAGPYFSSPATYSPLPFAQHPGLGGRDFIPFGRQPAASHGYGYGYSGDAYQASAIGLGTSQGSEPTSVLRSSSASSVSSTSSFAPPTPNTTAYFSPPLTQSSPMLFSPPLPSSPSFSTHSAPAPRRTNHLDTHHSRSPSVRSPSTSETGDRRRGGHPSSSIQHGQGQDGTFQPRRGPRESVNKAPTPVGIGTRPDEEVKKRKRIVVRLPNEGASNRTVGEQGPNGRIWDFPRQPLGIQERRERMAEMERDTKAGMMLEEDELVARPQHFEEVKSSGLPPTIDVYLPGQSGWDVVREEFEQNASSSFDAVLLAESRQVPSPLSEGAGPASRLGDEFPVPAFPVPAPVLPERSHTRTYSLFNSPVALPARLRNVLDSLSRRPSASRHAFSMSLGGSGDSGTTLDPSAASYYPSTAGPARPAATPTLSSTVFKLTPLAPSFSMPSWSTLKARAQAIPLPDSDESVAEKIEENGEESEDETEEEAGRAVRETTGGRGDGDWDERERFTASSSISSAGGGTGTRQNASSQGQVVRGSVEGKENVRHSQAPGVEEEEEDKLDNRLRSRRTSVVLNRTDLTGVASLSDSVYDRGEQRPSTDGLSAEPALVDQSFDTPPASSRIRSTPLSPLELFDLPPLPPSEDGTEEDTADDDGTAGRENTARAHSSFGSKKGLEGATHSPAPEAVVYEVRVGAHKVAQSFEFPRRTPQKKRSPVSHLEADESIDSYNLVDDEAQLGDGPLGDLEPAVLNFAGRRNESSPPLSPTLFGTNGGPGSLALSSLPGSPTMRDAHMTAREACHNPLSSATCSRPDPPRSPYPDASSIICPIPRRPYLDLQSGIDESTFECVSRPVPQNATRSFDFKPPRDAPHLPRHNTEATSSPRKVSHGPLPPIPLLHVESSTKSQRIDASEDDSTSSSLLLGQRPVSNTSIEDAIPPQYVPHLAARDRGGRRESEDIALPSSSRPKHRALPVPPSSSVEKHGRIIERESESSYAESIHRGHSSSVEAEDFAGDADDPQLRILESIIERQFEPLRTDLARLVSSERGDHLFDKIASLLSTSSRPLSQPDTGTDEKLEEIGSKLSSLVDGQHQLARTTALSRDATSMLKDAMAQLGLDVTSRLDSAYSALDQRLRTDEVFSELHLLSAQLAELRSDSVSTVVGTEKANRLARLEAGLESAESERVRDRRNLERLEEEKKFEARKALEFQQLLETRSAELEAMKAELEVTRSERDQAKREVERVVSEGEELSQRERAELDAAKGEISALEKRLTARDERIEGLVMAKSAQQQLLAKANRTAALLREQLGEPTREVQEEVNSARGKSKSLEAENHEAQQRFKRVELDLVTIRSAVTTELNVAKERIEALSADRNRLLRENARLARQCPLPRSPSPSDDGPTTPQGNPATPPFSRLFSNGLSRATKLDPQHTGGSDDSDDTVAHTTLSPTLSVAASFCISEDGWYSIA